MEATEDKSEPGKKYATFTVSKKRQIVQEIESGKLTLENAVEKYGLRRRRLMDWIATHAQDPGMFIRTKPQPAARRQAAMAIKSGKMTVKEVAHRYSLSVETIKHWVTELAQYNGSKAIDAPEKQPVSTEVEELQLRIRALETMIDLAEQEFNIPIRKKCGTKQSSC